MDHLLTDLNWDRISVSNINSNGSSGNGDGGINIACLLLALLCPCAVLICSYHLKLQLERQIVVSVTRTIVQLLLAGYLLLKLIFSLQTPLAVFCYLILMGCIAALEVTSRQVQTYEGHYCDALTAVLVGGGGIGIFGSIFVFTPTPWWNPHVTVPTCGMIIGNAISGPSLAVDRLLSEAVDKSHEIETRLCFGASRFEAVRPTIRAAVKAALMPNLNQMAVVGLVSIPGMMTGQLLGGAPPLVAAEYQMVILWLIFGTGALSTLIALWLCCKHAVFDDSHKLTLARIVKKSGKVDIDKALYNVLASFVVYIASIMKRFSNNNSERPPVEQELSGYNEEILNGLSAHGLLPASALSADDVVVVQAVEYKAVALVLPNSPSASPQLPVTVSTVTGPVLQLSEWNVLSGAVPLLSAEGISINVLDGQIISVEGMSGIGKTRLLRSLCQLDSQLTGRINYRQSEMSFTTSIPQWRARCIYVPQALSVLAGSPKDLLLETCEYESRRNFQGTSAFIRDIDQHCQEMEAKLQLGTGKLRDTWKSLSGGERQRAAIACALLGAMSIGSSTSTESKCILLLDEPTAACDVGTCAAVEKAIVESGHTIFIITHDEEQSRRLAHQRIIFSAPNSA